MDKYTKRTLAGGAEMPMIGLGLYKTKPEEARHSILSALEEGYRHFDTATFYHNEAQTGDALKEARIPREELFLATKLWPLDFGRTEEVFFDSLRMLKTDYVDLYMHHWPGVDAGLRLKSFETVLKLQQKGYIRVVGTSNYLEHHLQEVRDELGVFPESNQIEVHPWFQRTELRAFCNEHNIAVTAWGPIFHGHLQEEPRVFDIGEKYGKSGAQATLRWHLQHGNLIIPKSVHADRIKENIGIFDFELSPEDMAAIDALDAGRSMSHNPDVFDGHVK